LPMRRRKKNRVKRTRSMQTNSTSVRKKKITWRFHIHFPVILLVLRAGSVFIQGSLEAEAQRSRGSMVTDLHSKLTLHLPAGGFSLAAGRFALHQSRQPRLDWDAVTVTAPPNLAQEKFRCACRQST